MFLQIFVLALNYSNYKVFKNAMEIEPKHILIRRGLKIRLKTLRNYYTKRPPAIAKTFPFEFC